MITPRNQLFIDGCWVNSSDEKSLGVLNPTDNAEFVRIAAGTPADVKQAAQAAKGCFDSGAWSRLGILQRAEILNRIGALIAERARELAELESTDVGKPLCETLNFDIPSSAQTFAYYAGLAADIRGDVIPSPVNEVLNYTVREPIGVVGMIIPWNFPFLVACRKIASALAAGNTVVIKPATWAPLSTLALGDIFNEAGLPAGAVNIVTGTGNAVGEAMIGSPVIHDVSFTGSTQVGRAVMKGCAEHLKGCCLELGGKSPAIVLPDCDMQETINGTLFGAYLNQGECCCAATRMLVHQAVYEEFTERFVAGSKAIKVGLPLAEGTQHGPLIHRDHLDAVLRHIELGRQQGAKLACGGIALKEPPFEKGNFLPPTVFVDVAPANVISREEIFGPVVVITKGRDEEELIRLANDTTFGLAASVWTTNLKAGHRIASQIQAGTVWMNLHNFVFPTGPYGGYKDSGIGRELGRDGLLALTQTKSIMLSLYERGFKWY
jgi:acyl-CoA reductase-like NAD-dependent aldehyde dehydrogenase